MIRILTISIAALVMMGMHLSAASAAGMMSGAELLKAMSTGGYVVYMRHAKTNKEQKDSDISDLSNCATQRNISDAGKEQAKLIAEGLKHYGVKFDTVLSSPYCRAVDTADIMFGTHTKADQLRYLTRLTPEEAADASAWLKKQFGMAPAAGTNTILISHTANLKKGAGIWPKKSGDINVFKPKGDGSYDHVGTITADEWTDLYSPSKSS